VFCRRVPIAESLEVTEAFLAATSACLCNLDERT